ncbi:MAG: isopentenyl-diphosphate Delta-isomerase [Oscillospiraceae bacterium]|nr:isopentenyl-diphosphate Delta-isomerase [Oscillospiraceae bacterium]
MESPRVILVDLHDEPKGTVEKIQAHEKPLLHRAFSVFIYKGDRLLIQQRAKGKYHCAGIWANTCCSHPKPGEETLQAAQRRLKEETGIIHNELCELFAFTYHAVFDNGLHEYEYDHVIVGEYTEQKIDFDKNEIEQMAWVNVDELLEDMQENPCKYAPWFITAAPKVIEWMKSK